MSLLRNDFIESRKIAATQTYGVTSVRRFDENALNARHDALTTERKKRLASHTPHHPLSLAVTNVAAFLLNVFNQTELLWTTLP